jgi:hypothetical protein
MANYQNCDIYTGRRINLLPSVGIKILSYSKRETSELHLTVPYHFSEKAVENVCIIATVLPSGGAGV